MNKIYIKIVDGSPVSHPVLESNLKANYLDHDFSTGVPDGYVEFTRVKRPETTPYQKFLDNARQYALVDGKWQDVWTITNLTDSEKTALIDAKKAQWISEGGPSIHPSFVWSEEFCCYRPPSEQPNDGKNYRWDEPSTSWKEW